MAFNPSPKVAAARDLAKQFRAHQVVILLVTGDQLSYASYGRNKAECDEAKVIADVAFDAVMARMSEEGE